MATKYFVFLYTPGEHWAEDRPVTEQPLADHLDYVRQLHEERRIIIEGPFKDNTGLMGIVEAGSLEEAQAIVDADPAVVNGVMSATVHPWHPTVYGYIDKRPW